MLSAVSKTSKRPTGDDNASEEAKNEEIEEPAREGERREKGEK
jgi:hypothetical protein